MSSLLFSPLKIRDLNLRNRVIMSPMCQYSAQQGLPNSWHFVHLGSRAACGLGMVIVEATAVSPEGRITHGDLGLWSDAHTEAFKPIAEFIKSQGSVPAIQLAHAGRKASSQVPWMGGKALQAAENPWQTYAPQAIPFTEGYHTPKAMTTEDEQKVIDDFTAATLRARKAGFEVVEIHMAHGYLLHEFLSPLSNPGKNLGERMMFPLDVALAVRKAWPAHLPVFVRISATDWAEGGWDLEQSLSLCHSLKALGVDLIDCSTGGLVSHQKIPVSPHYQVPFAAEIKKRTGLFCGAVGLITEAQGAENILQEGQADVVILARELLRNPMWPIQAAKKLGAQIQLPVQYQRAY